MADAPSSTADPIVEGVIVVASMVTLLAVALIADRFRGDLRAGPAGRHIQALGGS